MGGELTATSRPGETTFVLCLPLVGGNGHEPARGRADRSLQL
jgi:hypothetical protein